MLKRKPFYFLRHGQTDWNVERRLQGQTDIPLNEVGRSQARAVKQAVADAGIVKLCVSELSRAYETARIVQPSEETPFECLDELREVTIGERDGHIVGDWFYQWRAGELVIPGAEVWSEFRTRIVSGINRALESEEPVLIVSHGGVYGALTQAITITPEISIQNCMLLYLEPDPNDESAWFARVVFEEISD